MYKFLLFAFLVSCNFLRAGIAMVSPEDKGAIGDGIANDTNALKAAIRDASRYGLLLTSGFTDAIYKVTEPITIPSNVVVSNFGIIKRDPTVSFAGYPVVDIAGGRPHGTSLSLRVDGSVIGAKGNEFYGIRVNNELNVNFNLSAQNCNVGIYSNKNLEHCQLTCYVTNNAVGVQIKGGSTATPDENKITVFGYGNSTDFFASGTHKSSGVVELFCEQTKSFAAIFENGWYTLRGYVRGAGVESGGGVWITGSTQRVTFDHFTILCDPTPTVSDTWGLLVEAPVELFGEIVIGGGSGGTWIKETPNSHISELRIVQASNCKSLPALRLGDATNYIDGIFIEFSGQTLSSSYPAVDLVNCRFSTINIQNDFRSRNYADDMVIGNNTFENSISIPRKIALARRIKNDRELSDNIILCKGTYKVSDEDNVNSGNPFIGIHLEHHVTLLGRVYWDGDGFVK